MSFHDFMKLQFNLIHIQKYNISEINDMQIWERDVHMDLLREYIKEQNLLNAQNSNKRKYK
jgi:hypothetical protein